MTTPNPFAALSPSQPVLDPEPLNAPSVTPATAAVVFNASSPALNDPAPTGFAREFTETVETIPPEKAAKPLVDAPGIRSAVESVTPSRGVITLAGESGGIEPEAAKRKFESLLYRNLDDDASDLHLSVDTRPWQGIHDEMSQMEGENVVDLALMEAMLKSVRTDEHWEKFLSEKRLDFSHATERSRFRCHYGISNDQPYGVFRTIANEIPEWDTLGLPEVVKAFAELEKGLVIFVGTTNSGKSSSLASLLDVVNAGQRKKIISIESPVEYLHQHKKSMFVQREVGRDVDSFSIGVEDAMREAPHIILVGELRDRETMMAAISAATSGHLVFATMHAESTADAPTRILDSMPAERIDEVRASLSRSLKAVVYQKLLPRKGEGRRVLAVEVLHVDPGVASMIRQNKLEGIQGKLMDTSKGNISFEASLVKLVKANLINERTARRFELREDGYDRLAKGL